MRATRRLCWSGLVLAAVTAGAVSWRKIAARPPVVARLHDGTEVRLIASHVGESIETWHHPTLTERWQAFTHSQPQPQPTRIGMTSQSHSIGWFFLTLHDPKTGGDVVPKMTEVDVLDASSAAHWVGRAEAVSYGDPRMPCEEVCLDTFPRRASQFRVRCKIDEESVEMTIPNRFRFTAAAQWKAEPLPQTRRVGEREYALKTVHIGPLAAHLIPYQKTPGPHFNAAWDLEVRDHGVPKTAYGITPLYEDETGNTSYSVLPANEAIWRLRATIAPHNLWEYHEDDVWSLGTVSVPKPGEYHEFPVPPKAAERGVVLIALLGAGHYASKDGKFTTAENPAPGLSEHSSTNTIPGGHYVVDEAHKTPGLMIVRRGEKALDPFDFAARVKGAEQQLDLTPYGSIGRSGWPRQKFEAVSAAFLASYQEKLDQFKDTVEVQLLDARSDTVEFTFPAPEPVPAEPAGPTR